MFKLELIQPQPTGDDMLRCQILSGISGSGKSTWESKLLPASAKIVFNADLFFMKNGEYKFDPSKLSLAHKTTFLDFIKMAQVCADMSKNDSNYHATLVVDNTNCSVEEIAPYYAVANAHDYKVELITFYIDTETAYHRNKHGVPYGTVHAQDQKLFSRNIPRYWDIQLTNFRWSKEQGRYL